MSQSPGAVTQSSAAAAAKTPFLASPIFALLVLFAMNLLNYVDRYAFFAAGNQIQKYLEVGQPWVKDFWFGILGVAFMIVYTIVSPFMGLLGDRYNRKLLLTGGVAIWSVATVGTAFSSDYWHIFFWRALLGVGEASYGVIAPALLADLFPLKSRGRAMGVYYLALPLGSALGYILGGTIAESFGWRAVFWIVGLPGLMAAAAGLVMKDPGRGASEGEVNTAADRPGLREYLELFKTRTYVLNTAGMAAVTFATGAYAAWGAIFYQNVFQLSASDAGLRVGLILVGGGILGILLGMVIPDLLKRYTRRAYLLVAAGAVLCAVPLGGLAVLSTSANQSLTYIFFASIMLSIVLGPCNTVTANVVPPNRRAAAYAAFIFLIHLFGDISSPVMLGWISDYFGMPSVADTFLGKFFAGLGAKPVENRNLSVAMLAVMPVLLIGFFFFILGAQHLPGDEDHAHQAGGHHAHPGGLYHH